MVTSPEKGLKLYRIHLNKHVTQLMPMPKHDRLDVEIVYIDTQQYGTVYIYMIVLHVHLTLFDQTAH